MFHKLCVRCSQLVRANKFFRHQAIALVTVIAVAATLLLSTKKYNQARADELCQAVYEADPAEVTLLLHQGVDANQDCRVQDEFADPDSQPDTFTRPLSVAAWSDFTEARRKIVELLTAHGADINYKDADGESALSSCVEPKMADLLIRSGARIENRDNSGRTTLFLAAQQSKYELLVTLVKAGANVDAKDSSGVSPLDAVGSIPLHGDGDEESKFTEDSEICIKYLSAHGAVR